MHHCQHCDQMLIFVAHRHSVTSTVACLDMWRCERGHESIATDNAVCLGKGEAGEWTWYREAVADELAFADALVKVETA
jgi:hypothetical protein